LQIASGAQAATRSTSLKDLQKRIDAAAADGAIADDRKNELTRRYH
jgi:hypothetical protein